MLINQIEDMLWDIKQDFHKATTPNRKGRVNNSAAQRVRVNSILLEKYFKIYRKESVLSERRIREEKKFGKLYPNTQKKKKKTALIKKTEKIERKELKEV